MTGWRSPSPGRACGIDAPRILLVDDDPKFAEVVRGLLAGDGYDVVGIVGSVADTVAAASETRPDVVIVDIVLPDGDGLDAADALRAEGVDTPVLVFSTLFDQRVARATMEDGYGYVEKAAGLEALELAIDAALELDVRDDG